MDDADIFHEAFRGYGGRVDPKQLPPPTAEAFEYQMGRARDFLQTAAKALPHLPPIYYDFVNWTFAVFAERGDASASRRPGEDKRGTPYP
jgi:hypothetical protein